MYSESEGINKLRKGSLIFVLASIFVIVAFFVLLIPLMAVAHSPSAVSAVIGILIAYVIVDIIGGIVGIIALFNVRKGFGILKSLGRDVGIGYTGTTLVFIAIALSILGSLLTFVEGEAITIGGYNNSWLYNWNYS